MFTLSHTTVKTSKDQLVHLAFGLVNLLVGFATLALAYYAYSIGDRTTLIAGLVFGMLLQTLVALIGYAFATHRHTDTVFKQKSAEKQHYFVMFVIEASFCIAVAMIAAFSSFKLMAFSLVAATVIATVSSFFKFD
jgi:DMSO reductase anchor subunit